MDRKAQAILAALTTDKISLSMCEDIAKDTGKFDSLEFDLVGPSGRIPCKWIDAYFGCFQQIGGEGVMMTGQFKYVTDIHCENLAPLHLATPPAEQSMGEGV